MPSNRRKDLGYATTWRICLFAGNSGGTSMVRRVDQHTGLNGSPFKPQLRKLPNQQCSPTLAQHPRVRTRGAVGELTPQASSHLPTPRVQWGRGLPGKSN